MLTKVSEFLNEYLRINAIRRMLGIVDVKKSEIAYLSLLALAYALFEGIGISLLLPILQYAEGGTSAITAAGPYWSALESALQALHLPLTLGVLLLLAFVPILLRQVVYYFNAWYSASVAGRIAVRVRMEALWKMLDADLDYYLRYPIGRIVSVLIFQATNAGTAVVALMRQLSTTLLIALYIAILFAISAPLTLVSLAFAVVIGLLTQTSIRRIRDMGLEMARINDNIAVKLVERFSLIRLIKMRHQKHSEAERIQDFSESTRALGVRQARLAANVEIITDPVLMISVFITLYVGISVLGMSLAQLGLLLFVLTRLNNKVREFNLGRQAISQNIPGLILVKEMSDDALGSNAVRGGTKQFKGLKREIALSEVSFAYPESHGAGGVLVHEAKAVLHDVSATIPAGSFTALVGRSGAGKSTLVDLLPRLRDVTSGSITYDGMQIREFDLATLRKAIGYLSQSAMLLNDTVLANLSYGLDFTPSDEQVRAALEAAHAEFVYDLPDGLQTMVGERGVRFSGGEGQRISLARVLLEDTPILILDEPTSALDSESEASIQDALAALHGKRTIIVIAHRLATVVKADQLLVFEDGRIVERGTHQQLLEQEGAYKRLFERQLILEAPGRAAPDSADEPLER